MTRKNPFRRPPAIKQHELDEPTCLITFMVGGRAVPWKVPDVRISRRGGSYTEKNKNLCNWQDAVRLEARAAWGIGRDPYSGPVGLSTWFYIHPPCKRSVRTADITNLVKALEDGIKGIVIGDDKEVFAQHSERYYIPMDEMQKAYVQIWAMPRGPIEPEDPGPYAYRPWEYVENPVLPVGYLNSEAI